MKMSLGDNISHVQKKFWHDVDWFVYPILSQKNISILVGYP